MLAVENKNGWHGKALDADEARGASPSSAASRNISSSTSTKPEAGEPARASTPATVQAADATRSATKVATRKAYGDALARSARPGGRGRARRRGQQLHLCREFEKALPRPLLRDVHRRAADGRGGGRDAGARPGGRSPRRSPRSSRAPTTSIRMAAISRAHHPALRLARGRLDRRGRPLADGAGGPRDDARGPRQHRPLSVRREPDGAARRGDGRSDGISYLRTTREKTPVLYGPDEEFPIGGSKVLRPPTGPT